MKKILLITISLLLISCSQEKAHLDEDYRIVETLKSAPTEIEEKLNYYIHDDMTPAYVMLEDYPNESLIDWDEETGINVKSSPELLFQFTQEEAVRGLEIESKNLKAIKIDFGSYEVVYPVTSDYQIIEFSEAYMTDQVALQPLETNEFSCILEAHLTCDINVDKTTYEVLSSIESELIVFTESYEWSNEPVEALFTYQTVLEDYTLEKIEMLSKDFDASRLKFSEIDYVGSPYRVNGKVVSVKERNNYFELTVDTFIDHEKITIYTMIPYEANNLFKDTCILVNQKKILTFITTQ